MNVCIKKVSHLPTMELVAFRCAIAALISFVAIKRAGVSWIGNDRKLLFARGAVGTLALFTFFITLQKIPLAAAVTIQYLSPIFTSLFAILFVGERISPKNALFYLVSMAGVFLMKWESNQIPIQWLAVGVLASMLSGIAYNLVRKMRDSEHPQVVVFHFQLIGAISGTAVTSANYAPISWVDFGWLVLIGLLTFIAQTFLTYAYQAENASKISIVNYSAVVFALIWGTLFFNEQYSAAELGGMAMVIAGVLLGVIFSK